MIETGPAPGHTEGGKEPTDPVRTLIEARASNLGLTMADMSRAVGKNQTYMHQFLHREAPKILPEEVRRPLAMLLRLPEDDLRSAPQLRMRVTPVKTAAALLAAASTPPASNDIPIYSEEDIIMPEAATSWIPRPAQIGAMGKCFAVWLTRNHGRRMSISDIAFVHEVQPPKPGDAVVVVFNGRITCIGDLVERDDDGAMIHAGRSATEATAIDLTNARIMKVVLLQLS